jgi:hypothetical protein
MFVRFVVVIVVVVLDDGAMTGVASGDSPGMVYGGTSLWGAWR